MRERGRSWEDFERISVYSDSVNDLPLLERATDAGGDQPVARARGGRARARLAHPEAVRMIKKFIDKLLGKPSGRSSRRACRAGKRVEVAKAEHGIDPTLVDERALKVVSTLADAGFEAYIVGGAVRDLLLGLRPKDFDVATNATPEQVKALFRRAFIIGRRFRIVHVVFGRGRQDRGLSEVIEVSTFRAYLDAAAAEQVEGNEKTSRSDMAGKTPRRRCQRAACCATTSGARRSRTPRGATSRSTRCTTTRGARSSSTTTAASRTRRRSCCA